MVAWGCALAAVNGATVSIDSLVDGTDPSTHDYIIRNASAVNLSSGYVGIGVFNGILDANVASSSYATLASAFVAFGTDNFVAGPTSIYGATSPGVTAIGSTSFDPSLYVGKTLYVFIGDVSLAGSNQFAVLKSTETVGLDAPIDNNNILFSTSTPIFGSYSSGTYNGTPYGLDSSVAAQAVNLVAVPEPTAALLGALGMVGLLRRRRTA